MSNNEENSDLLTLTTDLVAAHVSNNAVAVADLPQLVREIYMTLSQLGEMERAVVSDLPEPAVSIQKSITPDFLICLEDGKELKMLKRHLKTAYGLSPDDYRQRWGLPHDYPMVAPNYAKKRSELAKRIGLGRRAQRAEN